MGSLANHPLPLRLTLASRGVGGALAALAHRPHALVWAPRPRHMHMCIYTLTCAWHIHPSHLTAFELPSSVGYTHPSYGNFEFRLVKGVIYPMSPEAQARAQPCKLGTCLEPSRGNLGRVAWGLSTFFSPSTIYILFPYSFRILVQNRVYILEYDKNTAPNRVYILQYSLYSC